MYLETDYNRIKPNSIIIDVRTFNEYQQGHIPGAVNIPLFTEEERHMIGKAYKQDSVNQARRLGVEYTSNKMLALYDKVQSIPRNHYQDMVTYCARGGYRSTFFSAAFSAIGIRILKIDGGYKAYRNHVLEQLPCLNQKNNYIVLHGKTGCGKTNILRKLKESGRDVLDLEAAANHRGSVLGGIGLGEGISQKQFESHLFHQMKDFKSNTVFVESESHKIGTNQIPSYIFDRILIGRHILVDGNLSYRIENIKRAYPIDDLPMEMVQKCLIKLTKQVGHDKIKRWIHLLDHKDVDTFIEEIMLGYYDRKYNYSINKYAYELCFHEVTGVDEVVDMILEKY